MDEEKVYSTLATCDLLTAEETVAVFLSLGERLSQLDPDTFVTVLSNCIVETILKKNDDPTGIETFTYVLSQVGHSVSKQLEVEKWIESIDEETPAESITSWVKDTGEG